MSDNILVPGDGIPNLNIGYGMWAKGLSGRFDLYLSAGETTTERDGRRHLNAFGFGLTRVF